MATFAEFLTAQPLLTLFLTIALGYGLGEVSVRGFSLGSGAVLFVGLAIGAIAPGAAPNAMVGSLGLLLFLYAVGVAYGVQFFKGFTSSEGIKANAAALLGLAASVGVTAAAMALVPSITVGEALGAFAGAGTSTATLQAAIAATGSDRPAVGYSVAYPFGVAVPILLLALYNARFKPVVDTSGARILHTQEVRLTDPGLIGKTPAEAAATLPADLSIAAIRHEHHNLHPDLCGPLAAGDVLLLAGPDKAALRAFAVRIGSEEHGHVLRDRDDLDYVRVFASRRGVVGRPLAALALPPELNARIVHVRRGDADLQPQADVVLEYGDRVGLLAPRAAFADVRRFFGDSIKGTSEISYIGIGIGAAIGLLVGLVPIPIPGLGRLTLGFAGVLLVALYLGRLRRLGGVTWTMPLSANLVLRNLGLTLFLAQVGLSSGATFVATVLQSGPLYLLLGAVIVASMVIVTLAVAVFVLRMPFDAAAGVVSGVTGNPAILAFASRIAPTDRPDIGYAMIFPSMTIVKILVVEVAVALGAA
ncbi:aspartate:alanine exchanger family transporter [Marinivivus vitaminiproducens]|uniref:aspartate:alanine exchanger family transporter n=1 Tax=Marinivivus vitaminiproducens TaxID=3035935 RepID=UPI00279F0F3F|nr:TrkA C-terminal domain-containing protein [Geminicoccaceae bacterium SCSIO 64248]